MNSGIGVYVEHLKGNIVDITYEMLGVGRKIADKFNVPLYALLIGKGISHLASSLGIANTVYVVDEPSLEASIPMVIGPIIKSIMDDKKISLLLIGGTNATTEVGTRLSAQFGLPFVNFCKDIQIDGTSLTFTSQLYGGKILTNITLPENSGVVAIFPGSFPVEAGKSTQTPRVETLKIASQQLNVVFKNYIEPAGGDIDISKQDILVCVGRGIQNQENMALAEDLARVLGGAVSGSRPIIDQGWLPLTRLVGKSGMSVKPKLYLALGISGAPEHVEGIKNSEMIIAINTDPTAPIFDIAHYGICADIFTIIPPFIEKIKSRI